MKIYLVFPNLIKEVEVSPDDPVNIIWTKFVINARIIVVSGQPVTVNSTKTFRELDVEEGHFINISEYYDSGPKYDRLANLELMRKDEVSNNNPNIPIWRTIGKGINLYGICNNDNCQAKRRQVIMQVASKEYNIFNQGFLGVCPMCKTHFNVDACSFYKCDYKCEGIYFDKMMGRWIDLPGNVQETSGGKDFYFDFNKNDSGNEGKVLYKKLILKVVNYHYDE